jgi:hypothetical protein
VAPIRLELRPSRRLAVCIAVVYGGAAAIVWSLPLSFTVALPLSAAIALEGCRVFRLKVRLAGAGAVTALLWKSDGAWVVRRRDGREHEARLLPGAFVHPRLSVLRLSGERPVSIVLFPDAVERDAFRRLRVRLALEEWEREGEARAP